MSSPRNVTTAKSTGADMAPVVETRLGRRNLMFGLFAVGLIAWGLVLGRLATSPNLAPWYEGLAKPWFNPPNVVFGPAWAALYLLMAFAFWRILCLPGRTRGRGPAIAVFLAMLALNVLWSFLFFDARSPLLGLIDIVPQWLLIGATIALFLPLDRLAAACLVPLALWVAFAGLLNFEIWRLN
jgi:tryptophan-rich sensory protein